MTSYLAGITAALYFVLFLEHIRAGAFWRIPFFCAYLCIWIAKLGFWVYALAHPPGLGWLPWIEPLLILLRLGMFIEAATLVTASMSIPERRGFLSLLGVCGILAILVTLGSHQSTYLAIRSYGNVAVAMSCLIGAGCFWIAPLKVVPEDRNHAAILTLYFCTLAATGLLPAKTGHAWRIMNVAYFAGALLCCALWMRYGLATLRNQCYPKVHARLD